MEHKCVVVQENNMREDEGFEKEAARVFEETLLPCPFCGGKAVLEPETFYFGPWYTCFCVKCGVMTPAGESKEDAAKIWNTRLDRGR